MSNCIIDSHTVFIICALENDFTRRNQFGRSGRGTGDTSSVDLLQNRKVLEVAAQASCVHCVSLLVLYTNHDISQRLRYSKRVKPVWIYKFGPVSTGTHWFGLSRDTLMLLTQLDGRLYYFCIHLVVLLLLTTPSLV